MGQSVIWSEQPVYSQPDWEDRLCSFASLLIRSTHYGEFKWGQSDCTAVTLKAIDQICLSNLSRYCTWHNALEAARASREMSFGTFLDDLKHRARYTDVDSGSIVVAKLRPETWERVGFVAGNWYVSVERGTGLILLPLTTYRQLADIMHDENAGRIEYSFSWRFPACPH